MFKKLVAVMIVLGGLSATGWAFADDLDPFGDPLTDFFYLSYQSDFTPPDVLQGDPSAEVEVIVGTVAVGGATESSGPFGVDIAGDPLGNGNFPDVFGFPLGAAIDRNFSNLPFSDGNRITSSVSSAGLEPDEVQTAGFIFIDNGSGLDLDFPVRVDYTFNGSAGAGSVANITIDVTDLEGTPIDMVFATTADGSLNAGGTTGRIDAVLSIPDFSANGVQVTVTAFGSGPDFDASVEVSSTVVDPQPIYVSSSTGGSADGVTFADEDILKFDPDTGMWEMVVNGSDIGLSGTDINAFEFLDDGSILMSFNSPVSLPGLPDVVDDSDIVRFHPTSLGTPTAGTFSLFFDGSDVDMASNGEDIDAIAVTDDGRLVISVIDTSTFSGLTVRDEDLVVFDAVSFGPDTAGTFSFYIDAGDVGLDGGDVNGATIKRGIYLSKSVSFTLPGASGDSSDLFRFVPTALGDTTSGTFAPFWDGSDNGFGGENLDAAGVGAATIVIPGEAGADLAITKLDAPDPVTVLDFITYTLEVTNNGPEDATGVTVTDFLPADVTYDSNTCFAADPVGTEWTWFIGPLPIGATESCEITVIADLAGLQLNEASVTGDQEDSVPSNNEASVTTTVQPSGGAGDVEAIYVSSSTGGSVDSVSFRDEDILKFDPLTLTWSLHFDGSDVLPGGDINGFTVLDDDSILMTFNTAMTISGVGSIDDSDIVKFTPTSLGSTTAGSFTLFFDGSAFGLTSDNEDIDAVGLTPDGKLVISTIGNFSVPGVSGADEDLIVFDDTSGTFSMYLHASNVGLTGNDVNGADVDSLTGEIYLSKSGPVSVTGFTGDPSDIFMCTPLSLGLNNSSCDFAGFFDGSDNGIGGENVDGLSVVREPLP